MINRSNYLAMLEYLEYRQAVYMDANETNRSVRISLRHFIKWLDEVEFIHAENKRPSFPDHMTQQKNKKGEILSPVHCEKIIHHAKTFLKWQNARGKTIRVEYIDTLRLPARFSAKSRLSEHVYCTQNDIEKIAQVYWSAKQREDICFMRDAFAGVFLYLSGARARAFVTLSKSCFDVNAGIVLQLPEMGVLTKGGKAGKTFLLPIPELKTVITDWMNYLESQKAGTDLPIYPSLSTGSKLKSIKLSEKQKVYGKSAGRYQALRRGMMDVCKLAGIEPLSPHKFRHGHGMWGITHAKDIKQLKAISQNMMHSSLGITDGIYGRLHDKDVQDILSDMT